MNSPYPGRIVEVGEYTAEDMRSVRRVRGKYTNWIKTDGYETLTAYPRQLTK